MVNYCLFSLLMAGIGDHSYLIVTYMCITLPVDVVLNQKYLYPFKGSGQRVNRNLYCHVEDMYNVKCYFKQFLFDWSLIFYILVCLLHVSIIMVCYMIETLNFFSTTSNWHKSTSWDVFGTSEFKLSAFSVLLILIWFLIVCGSTFCLCAIQIFTMR